MLSWPVDQLLDELARGTPVPGAGPASAVVTAIAAALTAMGARSSHGSWAEAGAAVAQAQSLRVRAGNLAQEDADALSAVLAARESRSEERPEVRDYRLGRTLFRAADVPLAIAETACDVALLAAHVTDHCRDEVRADVATAAVLAHGAARGAAHLVEINLATSESDARITRARDLVRVAGAAADEAVHRAAS